MNLLLCISFFLFSSPSFADLNQIALQGFNLDYTDPNGVGELEKVKLDFKGSPENNLVPYPLELTRLENGFEFKTQFVEISWLNAWKWLVKTKRIEISHLNLSAHNDNHFMNAEKARLLVKEEELWGFDEASIECKGTSRAASLDDRLWSDCLNYSKVEIGKLYLPKSWKWVQEDWPGGLRKEKSSTEDPLKDLYFDMDKGNFSFNLKLKYIIAARLRIWGKVEKQVEQKRLAVKVDKAKLGIVSVYSMLFNLLEKHVDSEKIKVERPWIYFEGIN